MFFSWPELHLGHILPKQSAHRRVSVGMTSFHGRSSLGLKHVAHACKGHSWARFSFLDAAVPARTLPVPFYSHTPSPCTPPPSTGLLQIPVTLLLGECRCVEWCSMSCELSSGHPTERPGGGPPAPAALRHPCLFGTITEWCPASRPVCVSRSCSGGAAWEDSLAASSASDRL